MSCGGKTPHVASYVCCHHDSARRRGKASYHAPLVLLSLSRLDSTSANTQHELNLIPLFEGEVEKPQSLDEGWLSFHQTHSLIVIDGLTVEEYIQKRTKEFNEHLRRNPRDVATWRQFAAFQVAQTIIIADSNSRNRMHLY